MLSTVEIAPNYMGNGCPLGAFSYVPSPDAQTLSVLFDEFKAEGGPARVEEEQSCLALIPISFQAPARLAIAQADFRGYGYLPAGAIGQFAACRP